MSVRGIWVGVGVGLGLGEFAAVLLELHPTKSKQPANSASALILAACIANCF